MSYEFNMADYGWLHGFAANRYSQFGEDGVLDQIFAVIGAANKWCFECGASDGLFFSNTRALIESGWQGVLVEKDADAFGALLRNSPKVADSARRYFNCEINAERTVDSILAEAEAPQDIDLVSIDIDGQDFYAFNAMIRYRPRVAIIEYDALSGAEALPPIGGSGQAGIGAISRLMMGKCYTEVYRTICNTVWVSHPFSVGLKDSEMARKDNTS